MKLKDQDLQYLCGIAEAAAKEAGVFIQSQFDQHYEKQHKTGGDSLASQVVTVVDMKAQEIILGYLDPTRKAFDLGLLTEELADDHSRLAKDYFWCIDPMDGTLPFTEQRTGYAVSIALVSQAGDPVIGVVVVPDLEQCFTAIVGHGVACNDQSVQRPVKENTVLHFYMDQSFLTEPYLTTVKSRIEAWAASSGFSRVNYISEYGGVRNALGVMQSGSGCYVKFPKERKGCGSIWDYAATRLMAEELGCVVCDAKGERLYLNRAETTFMNQTGILYATDQALASALLEIGNGIQSGK